MGVQFQKTGCCIKFEGEWNQNKGEIGNSEANVLGGGSRKKRGEKKFKNRVNCRLGRVLTAKKRKRKSTGCGSQRVGNSTENTKSLT